MATSDNGTCPFSSAISAELPLTATVPLVLATTTRGTPALRKPARAARVPSTCARCNSSPASRSRDTLPVAKNAPAQPRALSATAAESSTSTACTGRPSTSPPEREASTSSWPCSFKMRTKCAPRNPVAPPTKGATIFGSLQLERLLKREQKLNVVRLHRARHELRGRRRVLLTHDAREHLGAGLEYAIR